MIRRDFHGWLLEDALQEIDVIVGNVRNNQKSEQAEFITGRGVIREAILNLLLDYGLKAEYQWGNDGVVTTTIE